MLATSRYKVCQLCYNYATSSGWYTCQGCHAYLPNHAGSVCPLCGHKSIKSWPRCFYGVSMSASPEQALELSPDFMNDENSECPDGRWERYLKEGAWVLPLRKMTCALCEYSRSRGPYEQNLCVASGLPLTRDSAFMLGADSRCVKGKWSVPSTPKRGPCKHGTLVGNTPCCGSFYQCKLFGVKVTEKRCQACERWEE